MASEKGLIYVCVSSEFNVAEFESCLLRRPDYLVLVVSDYQPARDGADRLEEAIRRDLPETRLLRTDREAGERLDARRLENCADWGRKTLAGIMAQCPADHYRVLNITGGNKTLMLSLLHSGAIQWDWLDYKPMGENCVERFSCQDHRIEYHAREPLPLVSPSQVAGLYNRHVEARRPNALFDAPGSLAAARAIWEGLAGADGALLALFASLETIWVTRHNEKPFRGASLSLPAQTLLNGEAFTENHRRWLEQWHALCPQALAVNGQELLMPGNNPKGLGKELRRWLCGDWLEQLVYHWLEQSLSEQERGTQLARNLVVNPSESRQSDSSRETDILLHHGGRTSVIEIKADLAPGQHVKQPTEQVSSLADRLGKTGKILFAGPQFVSRLRRQGDDYEARFMDRCKAADVHYVTSRQALCKVLGLTGRTPSES